MELLPRLARRWDQPEHPEIVAEIRSRIERLISGFPETIRQDYEQTRARKAPPTPVGNFPGA